jgi:hypothetical protein
MLRDLKWSQCQRNAPCNFYHLQWRNDHLKVCDIKNAAEVHGSEEYERLDVVNFTNVSNNCKNSIRYA